MHKSVLAALAAFGLTSSSQAAALLTWDFGTGSGNQVTAASTANDPLLQASTLSRGAGFPADNVWGPAPGYGAFNMNAGNAAINDSQSVTMERYVQFSVVPLAGNNVSLTSVDALVYSQNNQRFFSLLYSLDGFATFGSYVGWVSANNTFTGIPVSWDTSSVAALQNQSAPITFRIYVTETVGAYEQRGLGNVNGPSTDLVVQGSVSPVPEPGLLGTLAFTGLLAKRRRSR